MAETLPFATEIFQSICARLRNRAADLGELVASEAPFAGWFDAETFLACRAEQVEKSYCEVTLRPTYGSEGLKDDAGRLLAEQGALRIGGSGEPGDHRWYFAEHVLLRDGTHRLTTWREQTEAAIARLLRLRWVRSASVLVVAVVGQGDVEADWASDLAALEAWQRPLLADSFKLTLPGGSTLMVRAFDVKRNPSDVLTSVTSR